MSGVKIKSLIPISSLSLSLSLCILFVFISRHDENLLTIQTLKAISPGSQHFYMIAVHLFTVTMRANNFEHTGTPLINMSIDKQMLYIYTDFKKKSTRK